jgi:phytoene dehydrogenase-like protein
MPDESEASPTREAATRDPGSPASPPGTSPGEGTPAVTRRDFVRRAAVAGAVVLPAIGAAALVRLTRKTTRPLAGGFVEDGATAGHRLRDGVAAPAIRERRRTSIAIVGGGVAGLSAAWWLARHGMHDAVVLELQSAAGGNSRSGETAGHAHPWGAHYVPVPDVRATYVRTLLEEMGVLVNGEWRETDLCAAPKERTFAYGRWREGLVEAVAAGAGDRDELRRFGEQVQALRATGTFTIPMARGLDAESPLDRLTMTEWLAREGYRGGAVRWMADYACRDDFGTLARDTSAWAALHYFAARDGDEAGPLTWPEGNGRIVRHLMSRAGDRVVPSAPVHRVERAAGGRGMRVLAGDVEWTCDAVIWAAPTFVASHVVEGAPRTAWSYAPWMVTNLVLERPPAESTRDFPQAWDNVIADSPALGYVVAGHQALRAQPEPRSVWTHYWALAHEDPGVARRRLYEATWRECAERVLADLERAHPDIRACVSRVDVRRYGHAMPRPVPGFLAARAPWWREERDARVLWANSDVSGLSLFEEAQYRGVTAAERAMALVGT